MRRTKEEIVDLKKYGFWVDIKELRNYSKSKTILLNKSAADALLKAQKVLPKSFTFKVKDGLRSLATQKRIVEIHEKQFKREHPENWLELLNKYTGGYSELKIDKLSFMNHRSGFAIDLTLAKGGREVDMGGVSLNERDNLLYFENKEPLNPGERKIRDNRRLLKKVMSEANFQPHLPEWWHWGYRS